MIETPYIPAGLGDPPPDFAWKGIEYHIGPLDEVTPLIRWLGNKTTCGVQTLCSGVGFWGVRRLLPHAEGRHNLELAEAGFVGQTNRWAVDVQAGPMARVPEGPPALAAMVGLNIHLRRALDMEEWWPLRSQPVMDLSHLVHLVRHILPATRLPEFDRWLEEVVARVDAVAPKPATSGEIDEFALPGELEALAAPHRGEPLPPDILDTTRPFAPEGRTGRALAFAASVRPQDNRYLRSPEAIRALEAGE
ncbi:hypothetical protein [Rhodobacter sp. CZR27]|uniref:hypothetical protein n=1 Tax=Rhodobacter sp. CZR27 TaxID=2033869 RepID=UPI000BBE4F88|nr:hypothetical protein [Rhodobacter sp. CZR27]